MRTQAKIAPSILAADFAALGDAVAAVSSHVDLLHVDVMDGHFVPNISIGPPVVASLSDATSLYLDCHLMITDPVRYLEALSLAGASGVTAHIEAIPDPSAFFSMAADLNVDPGLVLNPPTPVEAVVPFLDQCKKIVVMSVHPGFGGQTFISDSLDKIAQLREFIDSSALTTDIEVDGGIDLHTVGQARSAGADILVAGTAIFGAENPAEAVGAIRDMMNSSENE
ncbi:MAG: ribulose-phosphate 3-epimerase [Acidimicrobiia bacterium]